jgi:hypothetical protein
MHYTGKDEVFARLQNLDLIGMDAHYLKRQREKDWTAYR